MIIFGTTILFDYLWKAALVGIAYFALLGHRIENPYGKGNFFILFGVFAFLGIYEIPAILSLDAIITVRNKEIAEFFGLEKNAHLMELYSIDWLDFVVWSFQAAAGVLVGGRLHRRLFEEGAPDASGRDGPGCSPPIDPREERRT